RGLVTAGGEHDAVDRIAIEDLDEAEIGEIAIERSGWALARLLDGMDGKFEGNASRLADAFAYTHRQRDVMPVAGRQIRARLGDADDRLAGGELLTSEAVVHVALEIERGHVGVVGVVEPLPRAQLLDLRSSRLPCVGHWRILRWSVAALLVHV